MMNDELLYSSFIIHSSSLFQDSLLLAYFCHIVFLQNLLGKVQVVHGPFAVGII